jgi:hypothetical protein
VIIDSGKYDADCLFGPNENDRSLKSIHPIAGGLRDYIYLTISRFPNLNKTKKPRYGGFATNYDDVYGVAIYIPTIALHAHLPVAQHD